ncbi:MAG: glycosyltransferase [Elusimicrobium sp.]|jgi:glycosyltransferase involved in cell wall biosynthesis|nr:glycosyltransferase [Elusimicrobium sp.]
MKLAIVNQAASTGGWRVLKKLALSLADRGAEITVFVHNTAFYPDYIDIFRKHHIGVADTGPWENIHEKLNGRFDAVLFFWPFFVKCPQRITIPVLFMVQDLTMLKHYGSGWNYMYKNIYADLSSFVQRGFPVCASRAGKKEFLKYFPNSKPASVLHWSSFADKLTMSPSEQKKILSKHGIEKEKYILYPTNLCPHKNVQAYLAAGSILKKRGVDIKLVLAGYDTAEIFGQFLDGPGITNLTLYSKDLNAWDAKGLGLLPDAEIDVVIANAAAVVTTSLAEGGCGPCSDAWLHGVPTVISDIEVLREYAEVYGVQTEKGDPFNAYSLADAVERILKNRGEYKKNAVLNAERINKNYPWTKAADVCLDIINRAAQSSQKNPDDKHLAVVIDFETQVDLSREGIGLFLKFLCEAWLKKYPRLFLDFWHYAVNESNFRNMFDCLSEIYLDRISFYNENMFPMPEAEIKNNFKYQLIKFYYKLRYFGRGKKYQIKKQNLKQAVQILPDKTERLTAALAKSGADYCFAPFIKIKADKAAQCPKILQIHDLLTIPLRDVFIKKVPDIDLLNEEIISNLNDHAVLGNMHFVCSTEYIKREQILRYGGKIRDEQVRVIPFPPLLKCFSGAPEARFKELKEKYKIPKKYIFYATQNRPSKNFLTLLKALKKLKNDGVKIGFVTTGSIKDNDGDQNYVKEAGIENMITETGSVTDGELYSLYKHAALVAVPTMMEGLGMSGQALEALAVGGIPVIHAKSAGIEESLKSAGLSFKTADLNWFDVKDYDTLAAKIKNVLKNPETHINKQKNIIKHYAKITWEETAEKYMNIFEGKKASAQ